MTWLNHRILVLLEEVTHASQDCVAVRTAERWDAATPSQPVALLQVNRSQQKHEPVGTNVNVLTSRIVFSPRRGMASKSVQRTTPRDVNVENNWGMVRGRFNMLNRDEPSQARGFFVGNRRSHQITDSESTSILVVQKFTERMPANYAVGPVKDLIPR
jgi:hypothetical protein